MAANEPWHSEMCPAMPVMTVMERYTTPSAAAWPVRYTNAASPRVNSTTSTAIAREVPTVRRTMSPAEMGAGTRVEVGGGSTPARGSAAWRARRRPGMNTSTPKSTTKGRAGVMLFCIGRSHEWLLAQRGRNVLNRAMPTPRPSPPR